ncbi:PucR family transcriptional regulator [Nocardia lijiangensis]|uniref:PucR family transcriptional regulator n=1 Tax=Nocardia lijiangensis TaxID=299618 RepID=UPI003D74FB84
MEVEWPPAQEPSTQRVWREVLRPIAGEMRSVAADLAERAVARMREELPELFPDAQNVAETLASVEAGLRLFAQVLELGADPRGMELPPPTLALAKSVVRRHIALADVMRLYRLAQERVWLWVFDRIAATTRDAAEQAVAAELGTRWIFAFADAAMLRAEQAYEVEREAWQSSATAARAAAIEEILDGRERDGQRASTRLRYEVNRHHIGVIAWAESVPDSGDALEALTESIAELARTVSAESILSHPLGSLAMAAWVSRRSAFTATDLDALGPRRDRHTVAPGVDIALGEPGRALDGFRRTHFEAAHARRVASMVLSRREALTRYQEIAVAALGTADRDHALAFVTRVLGPLAADDETTYRLAMTLAVYLDENFSRLRAAERLTVHPNTVTYRVHQAEALLGRSISTETLALRVALELLPTLPGLTQSRPTEL